jgi:hypothetical protein
MRRKGDAPPVYVDQLEAIVFVNYQIFLKENYSQ